MLALTNVDPDTVFDLMDAWLTGHQRVWLRSATDPATGLESLVIWGRSDNGPLAVYARQRGHDIEVYNATHLTEHQVAEFEKWEATHDE